jgi:nucleoside phosphorylase
MATGDTRPAMLIDAALATLKRKWKGPDGRRTRSFRWSEVRGGEVTNGDFKLAWHTYYVAKLFQQGHSIGRSSDESSPDFDFEFLLREDLEEVVLCQDASECCAYRRRRSARRAEAAAERETGSASHVVANASEPHGTAHHRDNPIAPQSRPTGPRAVVLTALAAEYDAVREFLTNTREHIGPQGTVYEMGEFAGQGRRCTIILAEIGAGNVSAAVEAERAINEFKPDVLMFVGVAGGRKDVKLGDVVVATKVYGYAAGKSERERFLPRPDVAHSSYGMEQRARAESKKKGWRALSEKASDSKVFVGPIAAGEVVVVNNLSAIAEFIANHYSDTLAVEMEGRGFLEAARAHHLEALIVRGISDLLSGKSLARSRSGQDDQKGHCGQEGIHG